MEEDDAENSQKFLFDIPICLWLHNAMLCLKKTLRMGNLNVHIFEDQQCVVIDNLVPTAVPPDELQSKMYNTALTVANYLGNEGFIFPHMNYNYLVRGFNRAS